MEKEKHMLIINFKNNKNNYCIISIACYGLSQSAELAFKMSDSFEILQKCGCSFFSYF